MRTLLVFFCVMLAFPVLASAAHVFIWNYDLLDVFYDSEAGTTINCAYWFEQIASSNGHTYETSQTLPTSLSGYDAVFVLLGWFRT